MSDHLPDCDDYAFSGAGFHPNCERICICRQVRRIEHRVEEAWSAIAGRDQYADGYAAGLDAAQEAVAALRPQRDGWHPDGDAMFRLALAAVDALREQPADQTGYRLPSAP